MGDRGVMTERILNMKSACFMVLLLGTFLFAGSLPTQVWADAGLKDVVSSLEQGYVLLNDVQADFSQRTAIASIKKEQLGNGTLYIKKPSRSTAMFRFNYEKPLQQI